MALSLVRRHGSPNEAAARYQAPWTIIDPTDSTSFMRAAIIGTCALVVLSGLSRLQPSEKAAAQELLKAGILSWLGFLVVVFGLKNWIHQRWPAKSLWEPRDRDHVNRAVTALVVPIAAVFVVLYAAPAWVLDLISGGRFDTTWATYTDDFQQLRLPCWIGLFIGLLGVQTFAAIQGRWNGLTRRINIALNLAMAALVLSFAVDGNIFQSSAVDLIARNVLAVVVVFYVLCLGYMLYGEMGRIERVVTPVKAQ